MAVLVETEAQYQCLPIMVRTDFSNFSSHFSKLTGDAALAAVSKEWRKNHKPCDFQAIS
jgi:hypothetical protein